MSNIQGVGGVQPPDFTAPKVRRVEQLQEVQTITDQVQISEKSAKIAEIAQMSELAKASADIRPEVIARAQERLASGEYLSPEATRKIAEKILEAVL